jgi:cytochrome P450
MTSAAPAYDPFSPQVMEDPHPVYRRLRAEAPAYFIERFDAWALSRFEDIWSLSSDPRLSAASGTTSSQLLTKVQPVTPMLNLMDPPTHTQLRAAIKPYFAPSRVRAIEPSVRSWFREGLEAVRSKGECDVLGDLSSRVSVRAACAAIGIPSEDADHLNRLVWRFFGREPGVEGMTRDGLEAAQELTGYFLELIAGRRRRGGAGDGDVVDLFLNIEIAGARLADLAIASHLSMLIIGGSETFPKTFANAVARLAEHPESRAECAGDPQLIPHAYQEALRFDMPTQFLGRLALEEIELHGQVIRRGQPVLFLYPSGNRDEREFDDPDRFDIHRRAPRILSFGAGTHSCLGLHVARMEGRVGLEELLAAIPEYDVDWPRVERLRTEFVQGFASLPIRFEPS